MDLSVYIKDSFIRRKGESIKDLIFILDGKLIDVFYNYNIVFKFEEKYLSKEFQNTLYTKNDFYGL